MVLRGERKVTIVWELSDWEEGVVDYENVGVGDKRKGEFLWDWDNEDLKKLVV